MTNEDIHETWPKCVKEWMQQKEFEHARIDTQKLGLNGMVTKDEMWETCYDWVQQHKLVFIHCLYCI